MNSQVRPSRFGWANRKSSRLLINIVEGYNWLSSSGSFRLHWSWNPIHSNSIDFANEDCGIDARLNYTTWGWKFLHEIDWSDFEILKQRFTQQADWKIFRYFQPGQNACRVRRSMLVIPSNWKSIEMDSCFIHLIWPEEIRAHVRTKNGSSWAQWSADGIHYTVG